MPGRSGPHVGQKCAFLALPATFVVGTAIFRGAAGVSPTTVIAGVVSMPGKGGGAEGHPSAAVVHVGAGTVWLRTEPRDAHIRRSRPPASSARRGTTARPLPGRRSMLEIVSGPVAPPVVKSVLVTLALQVLDRPPRSSVTVTAPICPEVLAAPGITEPRFDVAGALIVRVPPVFVNVVVVSSAVVWNGGRCGEAEADGRGGHNKR